MCVCSGEKKVLNVDIKEFCCINIFILIKIVLSSYNNDVVDQAELTLLVLLLLKRLFSIAPHLAIALPTLR